MGVIFDEPKYPVIDKAPGFWQTGTLSLAVGVRSHHRNAFTRGMENPSSSICVNVAIILHHWQNIARQNVAHMLTSENVSLPFLSQWAISI